MSEDKRGDIIITGEDGVRAVAELARLRAWRLQAHFKTTDGSSFKAGWTIKKFNQDYGRQCKSWQDVLSVMNAHFAAVTAERKASESAGKDA